MPGSVIYRRHETLLENTLPVSKDKEIGGLSEAWP